MGNSKVQLGIFKSIIFDFKSLFSTFSEENEIENGLDYYANKQSIIPEDVENAKIAKELQKSLANIEKTEKMLDTNLKSTTSKSKSQNISTKKSKVSKEIINDDKNNFINSSIKKSDNLQKEIDERD